MRIAQSAVAMQGEHHQVTKTEKRESLRVWVDSPAAESPATERPSAISPPEKGAEPAKYERVSLEPSLQDRLKLELIQKLLGKLTDQDICFCKVDPEHPADDAAAPPEIVTRANQVAQQGAPQGPKKAGWGIAYDYHESYSEVETSSFTAAGKVQTADGKSIDFSVQLQMSRSFMESRDIRLRAGDAPVTDPLVINFDGTAAELTQTKFRFDIDADGESDQVSFVSSGSGFLALDLNGDEQINDGHELFGPRTGEGFAELAAYDEDRNGWIDEADSVYDRLRIWTKDEKGQDQLFALGQKNVGAIFVGSVATPFQQKTAQNELLGKVRSTGVFLKEDGSAGTVQQIDLAV